LDAGQRVTLVQVLDVSATRSEYVVKRVSGPGALSELSVVPMLAGPPRRVGDVTAEHAAWSPDGRQIAYMNGNDVSRVSPDGTGVKKVASFSRPPGIPRFPHWSQDRLLLRFSVTFAKDRSVTRSLWQITAEGRDLQELLPEGNEAPKGVLRTVNARWQVLHLPV